MNIRAALAAAVTVLALALTGCAGANDPATETDHSEHVLDAGAANSADFVFVSLMIPHHEQAIVMSDIVRAKEGVDERVVELAEEIKAAQGPEIEQLQTWLAERDADPDAQPEDHSAHMDGMLSGDDIAKLEAASGAEASVLFLEQMIAHHEGAVAMAETEVSGGENLDAVRLAENIIETQGVEIETMRGILASL